MDKVCVCVCVGYVGGATATAIDRLVGDKVGWPRRGVSGQWELAKQLHARARSNGTDWR